MSSLVAVTLSMLLLLLMFSISFILLLRRMNDSLRSDIVEMRKSSDSIVEEIEHHRRIEISMRQTILLQKAVIRDHHRDRIEEVKSANRQKRECLRCVTSNLDHGSFINKIGIHRKGNEGLFQRTVEESRHVEFEAEMVDRLDIHDSMVITKMTNIAGRIYFKICIIK